MSKWMKGAKWDLMVRFEDGSMYRLSSLKEKTHTNAAMFESIAKNFLPVLEEAKKEVAEMSRRASQEKTA